jgi:hypothetical protein
MTGGLGAMTTTRTSSGDFVRTAKRVSIRRHRHRMNGGRADCWLASFKSVSTVHQTLDIIDSVLAILEDDDEHVEES